jgi:lipopolysaccharide export LptBFGC system permease protein LptF
MKTLDRYIVRSFITSLLLWFVVVMSLRTVTDLFVNMDEFAKLGRSPGETLSDIGTYYGYQSAAYLLELGGVIIVAAAAFSIARMNYTNELTAILASGVSLHRVIWPILLCAMATCGLLVADQELLIPRIAPKLVRSRDDAQGLQDLQLRCLSDGTGASWYAPKYLTGERVMRQPRIIVRDKQAAAIATIAGDRGVPTTLDGVPGWLVFDANMMSTPYGRIWPQTPNTLRVHTSVDPQVLLGQARKEELRRGASLPNEANALVISNVDGAGCPDRQYGMILRAGKMELGPLQRDGQRQARLVAPRFVFQHDGQMLGIFIADSAAWRVLGSQGCWELTGGALFYPSDLGPDEIKLRQHSRFLDCMSTAQLTNYLKLQRVPDPRAAQIVRHTRVADPINNIIMLLLGLPFILSRERNIKASAGLCVLMVGSYYAFIYICRYMDLPPAWAAWLPSLLFGPVAAVMVDSVKT